MNLYIFVEKEINEEQCVVENLILKNEIQNCTRFEKWTVFVRRG
jgi:hypothetical protein